MNSARKMWPRGVNSIGRHASPDVAAISFIFYPWRRIGKTKKRRDHIGNQNEGCLFQGG
jgi:hypothetical protein